MAQPTVTFKLDEHRDQLVLSIYSPKSERLIQTAKSLNAKWSASKKMWWLPYGKGTLRAAFEAFNPHAWVDYSAVKGKDDNSKEDSIQKRSWSDSQKEAMWAYANKLKARDYSQSTYNTYGHMFKQFLAAFPNSDPKEITEEEVKGYLLETVKTKQYASKTVNQMISAIKFYYEQVLDLKRQNIG